MSKSTDQGAPFVARYRTENGVVHALCIPKRTITHAVLMTDVPLKARAIRGEERRFLTPLEDYPVKKAAKHFRHAGRSFGITKGARALIREATTSINHD